MLESAERDHENVRVTETAAADLSNQITNLQGFRCVLRYPVYLQGAPWQCVTEMTIVSQCLSGSRPDHPKSPLFILLNP